MSEQLISADKLREWLKPRLELAHYYQLSTAYRNVLTELESGNFDHTPVHPDTMVNWIPYDQANPPTDFEIYFIYQKYNGKDEVCTAYRMGGQWFTCQGTEAIDEITHYAEFNLPGEETDNV